MKKFTYRFFDDDMLLAEHPNDDSVRETVEAWLNAHGKMGWEIIKIKQMVIADHVMDIDGSSFDRWRVRIEALGKQEWS